MDFSLKQGSLNYIITVELEYHGDTVERYKVQARDNPAKYIILECNRPLLRQKYLLQNKKLVWKVKEGNVGNMTALNEVIQIIEDWIEPPTPKLPKQKGY